MRDVLLSLAIIIGVCLMFVASLGVLRLPDFYIRAHAPTKAVTLGLFALIGALLAAVLEARGAIGILAALFVGATNPISAHVMLRGAYRTGVRPQNTTTDEYSVPKK